MQLLLKVLIIHVPFEGNIDRGGRGGAAGAIVSIFHSGVLIRERDGSRGLCIQGQPMRHSPSPKEPLETVTLLEEKQQGQAPLMRHPFIIIYNICCHANKMYIHWRYVEITIHYY